METEETMSEEELVQGPDESNEDFENRKRLAAADKEVPLAPEDEEMDSDQETA